MSPKTLDGGVPEACRKPGDKSAAVRVGFTAQFATTSSLLPVDGGSSLTANPPRLHYSIDSIAPRAAPRMQSCAKIGDAVRGAHILALRPLCVASTADIVFLPTHKVSGSWSFDTAPPRRWTRPPPRALPVHLVLTVSSPPLLRADCPARHPPLQIAVWLHRKQAEEVNAPSPLLLPPPPRRPCARSPT